MAKHVNKNTFFCPQGKKNLGQRPMPSAGARSKPCKRLIFKQHFLLEKNLHSKLFSTSRSAKTRKCINVTIGSQKVISKADPIKNCA